MRWLQPAREAGADRWDRDRRGSRRALHSGWLSILSGVSPPGQTIALRKNRKEVLHDLYLPTDWEYPGIVDKPFED